MDTTDRFMDGLRELLEKEDAKTAANKSKAKTKAKKPYIKPKSIIKLQEDYYRWRLKQGEDCSQPLKHTFSDDGANELTRAIVAHVYCHGGFAGRVNTMGTYKESERRFTRTNARKGMADVNACIKGRHVQIEVKYGSDRPRESQLQVRKEVEAAGGVYIFVKTFDDYLRQVESLF